MQPAHFLPQLTLLDRQRFTRLWKSLCAEFESAHCDLVFDELAEYYNASGRYYHTDAHIYHCLNQLDQSVDHQPAHPHVEMAIWCHDVIYAAGDPDNEKNSADWFRQKATGHISDEDIETIVNIITITEHRDSPVSEDEKLMVDIDLSSFGLPSTQFEEDSEKIRREFSDISDDVFIKGQISFLQALLNRQDLYSTSYFHSHYEIVARNNIKKLLARYQTTLMH